MSTKQKILEIISRKMNEEHDEHAKLISEIKNRVEDEQLLDRLTLVYRTRIRVLEYLYNIIRSV